MTTKTCTICKVEKPKSEFSPRKDRGPGALESRCKPCNAARSRKWAKNNPEKNRARSKNQQQKHYDTIMVRRKEWRSENIDSVRKVQRSITAKYRASKLQRTPAWSEELEIKQVYADCPEGYHVDHIVPLQGELVSGLHVLGNLQYLPGSENSSKSNNFSV